MTALTSSPSIKASVGIPGSKSITHRALIAAALQIVHCLAYQQGRLDEDYAKALGARGMCVANAGQ